MIREGLDPQAARDRIYILDTQGLVCDNREGLDEYKRRYAKPGLCWPSGICRARRG